VVFDEIDEEKLRALCRDADHLQLVRALGPRSAAALPLIAHGRVLGAITLASDRAGRYGARELGLAEELAHRIALAIDNARLYHESQVAIGLRDEFLSVASHELRTPVNSLQLAVQGLRTGVVPASPERLPGLLELAERQTTRMTRLIDEMLTVGRLQEGRSELRLEPTDLAAVARDVAAAFAQEAARARSTLAIHAPAPVVGRWDRTKIEQVVTNLLSNAIKFGAGSPIDVTASEAAGFATLVVRDRGIGIPAADLPRIFERFARAVSARHYGGLGLGLYIVRAIVDAHGGSVRAESVVGEGATFTVELPLGGAAR
jgi:signal transduction histidine kinase